MRLRCTLDDERAAVVAAALIGLPPAAALGSLASVALSSEQAKQFYPFAGRIPDTISFRFFA
jgi:hypothetical protein